MAAQNETSHVAEETSSHMEEVLDIGRQSSYVIVLWSS